MDVAYDSITDEALAPTEDAEKRAQHADNARPTSLNAEFQEAVKAVSASPWGSALGGWLGEARKQGQAFYTDLQKEASEAQGAASKRISGFRDELAKRTGGLGLTQAGASTTKEIDGEATEEEKTVAGEKREGFSADLVKEAGALVSSLRTTAAARFKDLQHAEDAADEALLKFGTNVRDFLREAVIITGPGGSARDGALGSEVLFETKEPGTGRKVFHTTRFDAQLHAIHSNTASFLQTPAGEKWDEWKKDFDVEQKTTAIATDLDRYAELRTAMEKLVPENIEYKEFWTRYYFLRSAVEEEEKRRKEVLKGAAAGDGETVGWDDDDDDDDDDDEEQAPTPNAGKGKFSASTTTLNAPTNNDLLKAKSPRRSHEDESKSVAGSDASYDIVSGATSRAPGSPKDDKKANGNESDDDWE